MKQATSYGVWYTCTNCNWRGEKRFDKGRAAPEKYQTCPKCSCNTLVKSWTQPAPVMPIPILPRPPIHPYDDDRPWYPGPGYPYPKGPQSPPWSPRPWDPRPWPPRRPPFIFMIDGR